MGKLINKPITVISEAPQGPKILVCGGSFLTVDQVLEIWKDTGAWWDGESEKTFYRLHVKSNGLFEIYSENGEWCLYKVYD